MTHEDRKRKVAQAINRARRDLFDEVACISIATGKLEAVPLHLLESELYLLREYAAAVGRNLRRV